MLLNVASTSRGAEPSRPNDASGAVDLPVIRRQHEQVRKQTSSVFRQAAFVSPAPDANASIPLSMAPLIVQEFPENLADMERSFFRLGAVKVTAAGLATVRQDQQTVYFLRSNTCVADQQRGQLTFIWFYPPASRGPRLRYRGLRITLGSRGFPVVWEILSSESRFHEIYVAKPLEQAALKQHGPPLPNRGFAVEPLLEDQPYIVVPRVVGEGPLPMSPFVYLTAADLRITTLICRCEPSQVATFPDSSHYQLREIENLAALYLGKSRPDNLPLPRAADDLESILRLPSKF